MRAIAVILILLCVVLSPAFGDVVTRNEINILRRILNEYAQIPLVKGKRIQQFRKSEPAAVILLQGHRLLTRVETGELSPSDLEEIKSIIEGCMVDFRAAAMDVDGAQKRPIVAPYFRTSEVEEKTTRALEYLQTLVTRAMSRSHVLAQRSMTESGHPKTETSDKIEAKGNEIAGTFNEDEFKPSKPASREGLPQAIGEVRTLRKTMRQINVLRIPPTSALSTSTTYMPPKHPASAIVTREPVRMIGARYIGLSIPPGFAPTHVQITDSHGSSLPIARMLRDDRTDTYFVELKQPARGMTTLKMEVAEDMGSPLRKDPVYLPYENQSLALNELQAASLDKIFNSATRAARNEKHLSVEEWTAIIKKGTKYSMDSPLRADVASHPPNSLKPFADLKGPDGKLEVICNEVACLAVNLYRTLGKGRENFEAWPETCYVVGANGKITDADYHMRATIRIDGELAFYDPTPPGQGSHAPSRVANLDRITLKDMSEERAFWLLFRALSPRVSNQGFFNPAMIERIFDLDAGHRSDVSIVTEGIIERHGAEVKRTIEELGKKYGIDPHNAADKLLEIYHKGGRESGDMLPPDWLVYARATGRAGIRTPPRGQVSTADMEYERRFNRAWSVYEEESDPFFSGHRLSSNLIPRRRGDHTTSRFLKAATIYVQDQFKRFEDATMDILETLPESAIRVSGLPYPVNRNEYHWIYDPNDERAEYFHLRVGNGKPEYLGDFLQFKLIEGLRAAAGQGRLQTEAYFRIWSLSELLVNNLSSYGAAPIAEIRAGDHRPKTIPMFLEEQRKRHASHKWDFEPYKAEGLLYTLDRVSPGIFERREALARESGAPNYLVELASVRKLSDIDEIYETVIDGIRNLSCEEVLEKLNVNP